MPNRGNSPKPNRRLLSERDLSKKTIEQDDSYTTYIMLKIDETPDSIFKRLLDFFVRCETPLKYNEKKR